MQLETLKRMPVWSGWLRLSHWAMALLLAALLFTGFVVKNVPQLADAARDYHYMLGHVLLFVFFLRVFLLFFGSRSELLQALIPGRRDLAGALTMFKFYFTLGRTPLAKWFAHNPFWMLIYLGFFAVLMVQMVTGFSYTSGAVFEIDTTHSLHRLGAKILLWFAALHTIAAFWHDAKGNGSDVSAMISGQRIFVIEKPQQALGMSKPIVWTPKPQTPSAPAGEAPRSAINPAADLED